MLDTMFISYSFKKLIGMLKKEMPTQKKITIEAIHLNCDTMAFIDPREVTKEEAVITINQGCDTSPILKLSDEQFKVYMCKVIAHEYRHVIQMENGWVMSKELDYADRPHEIDAEDFAWDFVSKYQDEIFSLIDDYEEYKTISEF